MSTDDERPGAGAVLPVPDRQPPRRPGPDRPVQLGLRAPPRRRPGVPHRGHRRRARQRGVLPAPARHDALARLRLGRGPRGRRPLRPLPPVRAPRHLRRRARPPARGGLHLRLLLHQRRGRRAAQGRGLEAAGVRRVLPRADRRAGRGVPGRGPPAGQPLPDARRRAHLGRPGARRHHVPDRARARLRGGAGQRPAAVHAGQPRRRRDDAHHPRAARRGPAVLDAAPARAVHRADRARHRRGDAAVRPPAVRDGRGQQEAVEARPAGQPAQLPRGRLPAGGPAQLPGPAGMGDLGRPRHLLDRGDGRGVRDRRREPQPGALRHEEGRGHQRRAHAAAVGRGDRAPLGPVPRRRRPRRRPADRRAAGRAGRRDAAGRRADQQAHRVRGDAGLPARRRGGLRA